MLHVSAPGKIHLVGEHAVVYGEPAVLASVGLRTTVSMEKLDGSVMWRDQMFGQEFSWDVADVLDACKNAQELWAHCSDKGDFSPLFDDMKRNHWEGYKMASVGCAMALSGIADGMSINVASDIPSGAGMGSSASLAACLAKGIPALFGRNTSLKQVNEIAFALEKLVHGNPSGGDNAACVFGGFVRFERGAILSFDVPHTLKNFVFVQSGKPEKTTGELVQQVARMDSETREHAVRELGRAAREMCHALGNDEERVKELMSIAQEQLSILGVSTPLIDRIAEAVRKNGGGAKLCGAGGGGIVLCYHRNNDMLMTTLQELGYEPLKAELGVRGVCVDDHTQ